MAFKDLDIAILVGSMPRREGMERKDLLKANVKIFKSQGAALDKYAKKTVKVNTDIELKFSLSQLCRDGNSCRVLLGKQEPLQGRQCCPLAWPRADELECLKQGGDLVLSLFGEKVRLLFSGSSPLRL